MGKRDKYLQFKVDIKTYGEFWEVVELLGEPTTVATFKRMIAIIKELY